MAVYFDKLQPNMTRTLVILQNTCYMVGSETLLTANATYTCIAIPIDAINELPYLRRCLIFI